MVAKGKAELKISDPAGHVAEVGDELLHKSGNEIGELERVKEQADDAQQRISAADIRAQSIIFSHGLNPLFTDREEGFTLSPSPSAELSSTSCLTTADIERFKLYARDREFETCQKMSSSDMALKEIQASITKLAETLGFRPEDALTGVIQQRLRIARDDVQRWKDLGDELNAVAEELEVAKTEADEAHKSRTHSRLLGTAGVRSVTR
ncbi:hypothetical protein K491DRAFT_726602 [Lophiostoma macrostomum CBS 122681]|uniref:Uncharacterized protein n=1 Tax=Lophiostoma macrostomum CBS 122681 TaxID=1314788 RepID=A0A6A6T012_9PLEO|nr:hypothetical protein K491DRAFT_726602 [Lophiostoma macrostomum CBS 122681]